MLYTSVFEMIRKYFILFDPIVNGIVFLISFLNYYCYIKVQLFLCIDLLCFERMVGTWGGVAHWEGMTLCLEDFSNCT